MISINAQEVSDRIFGPCDTLLLPNTRGLRLNISRKEGRRKQNQHIRKMDALRLLILGHLLVM